MTNVDDTNGWSVGAPKDYTDAQQQDQDDAQDLYETLESPESLESLEPHLFFYPTRTEPDRTGPNRAESIFLPFPCDFLVINHKTRAEPSRNRAERCRTSPKAANYKIITRKSQENDSAQTKTKNVFLFFVLLF